MTTLNEVTITLENPRSEAAARLIQHLSAELAERYDHDDGSGSFTPADVETPGGAFVLAWLNGQPIGCGALRPMSPGVGEVKRMFVEKTARGRGLSRQILAKLEEVARDLDYTALRLETGLKQPEAIGLYESAGYHRIANYGHYVNNPLSVCFEKSLKETKAQRF